MKIIFKLIALQVLLAKIAISGSPSVKYLNLSDKRFIKIDTERAFADNDLVKISEVFTILPPINIDKVFSVRVVKYKNDGKISKCYNYILNGENITNIFKKNDVEIGREDDVIYLLK